MKEASFFISTSISIRVVIISFSKLTQKLSPLDYSQKSSSELEFWGLCYHLLFLIRDHYNVNGERLN